MAGVPIDKRSKLRGQDRYWAVIRDLAANQGEFMVQDVAMQTNASTDAVREYMQRLARGGFLAQVGMRGQAKVYRRVQDQRTAPRLQKDGTPVATQARELMWRTMKMLKVFTAGELAALAGTAEVAVDPEDARNYLKHLYRAEYLARIEPAKGRQATYRFLRNTGPLPPKVQRVRQVFDPNLGRVVWSAGGDA